MKHALLLLLVPSLAFAQPISDPMPYEQAVAQSITTKRCIQNEKGQLFRHYLNQNEAGDYIWEQCSVDTGWVMGPLVKKRAESDEFKKAKWQVTSCRCQHE